jgi:hypothetical protein
MFFQPHETWIGGHQEPCGLRCAVFNHGPGDLEWTVISPEDIMQVEKSSQMSIKLKCSETKDYGM